MAKKFIDAEITKNAIQQLCNKYNIAFDNGHGGFGDNLKETLDTIQAADVQEVRYGYWENVDAYSNKCSCCGRLFELRFYDYNYCPRCGARMDGELK